MAGLVPATPITGAPPCPIIGAAGTSPAMTAVSVSPSPRCLLPLRAGIGVPRLVQEARISADALHAHVDVGIVDVLVGSPAADFEIDRIDVAAVDEAVAIGDAG